MSKENLVYNEPFELDNWIWEINGTRYFVNKYREIQCNKEAGIHYDFTILKFHNANNEHLFDVRKYNDICDGKNIYFFCNPYVAINTNLSEMLQKLREKYQVEKFYYFEIGKGYQKLEQF